MMKGNLTVKKWKNKGAFGRKKAMKTNKICKQVVFIWKAEWNNNVIKSQFITQTITIAFDCKDNNFNCLKINCSKNCSAATLQLLDTCRADLKKVKTAQRFCQYFHQFFENEIVNMCAAYFFCWAVDIFLLSG